MRYGLNPFNADRAYLADAATGEEEGELSATFPSVCQVDERDEEGDIAAWSCNFKVPFSVLESELGGQPDRIQVDQYTRFFSDE